MPVYIYQCEKCKNRVEVLQGLQGGVPLCCGKAMTKMPTFPAMVKMKGMGGYPSRRKQFKGTAPYTSRSTRPNVDVVNERIYGKS